MLARIRFSPAPWQICVTAALGPLFMEVWHGRGVAAGATVDHTEAVNADSQLADGETERERERSPERETSGSLKK